MATKGMVDAGRKRNAGSGAGLCDAGMRGRQDGGLHMGICILVLQWRMELKIKMTHSFLSITAVTGKRRTICQYRPICLV